MECSLVICRKTVQFFFFEKDRNTEKSGDKKVVCLDSLFKTNIKQIKSSGALYFVLLILTCLFSGTLLK